MPVGHFLSESGHTSSPAGNISDHHPSSSGNEDDDGDLGAKYEHIDAVTEALEARQRQLERD
jgi:hypothetical protein